MSQDLTYAEAIAAFRAFNTTVGGKCDCSVILNVSGYVGANLLRVYVWPDGAGGGSTFTADGNTYREVLAALESEWAKRSDTKRAETVRAMALEIIVQTADHGECTDAALRAKFSAREVEDYGVEACSQASEMASNGPFLIVALAGANAS